MALVLDTARPSLRALAARAADRGAVHRVMGVSGTRIVKDRFALMADVQRNPWGKAPQFWKRMNRATRWESGQDFADVVMPREVAQRFYGGPIKPTGGRKYLTIPAHRSAYRRSARSFQDLKLVLFGRGSGAKLALAKKTKTATTVLYWLVKGVTQAGDSRVIPTPAEFAAGIEPDVMAYLRRESSRGSRGGVST